MRIKTYLWGSLLCVLFLGSCQISRNAKKDMTYSITFGIENSSKGIKSEYVLKQNGTVWSKQNDSLIFVSNISKDSTKSYFNNFRELKFNKVNFTGTGTKIYYLEKSNTLDFHRVQWTETDTANLKIRVLNSFHRRLMNSIIK